MATETLTKTMLSLKFHETCFGYHAFLERDESGNWKISVYDSRPISRRPRDEIFYVAGTPLSLVAEMARERARMIDDAAEGAVNLVLFARRKLRPAIVYRRVNMALGGWKWGYPRGHRIGIARYVSRLTRDGRLVWRNAGYPCEGLTAANISYYQVRYPDAFRHKVGGLHNKPVDDETLVAEY